MKWVCGDVGDCSGKWSTGCSDCHERAHNGAAIDLRVYVVLLFDTRCWVNVLKCVYLLTWTAYAILR